MTNSLSHAIIHKRSLTNTHTSLFSRISFPSSFTHFILISTFSSFISHHYILSRFSLIGLFVVKLGTQLIFNESFISLSSFTNQNEGSISSLSLSTRSDRACLTGVVSISPYSPNIVTQCYTLGVSQANSQFSMAVLSLPSSILSIHTNTTYFCVFSLNTESKNITLSTSCEKDGFKKTISLPIPPAYINSASLTVKRPEDNMNLYALHTHSFALLHSQHIFQPFHHFLTSFSICYI